MFYDDWKDGNEAGLFRWPGIWQTAAYVPAIDYVRASRIRSLLMQRMEAVMRDVDLYVGGNDLVLTNLTGHPTVVMPYRPTPQAEEKAESGGQQETDTQGQQAAQIDVKEQAGPEAQQPRSITFSGGLHKESQLLQLADAFQRLKQDNLVRPPLFDRL